MPIFLKQILSRCEWSDIDAATPGVGVCSAGSCGVAGRWTHHGRELFSAMV